MQYNLPQYTLGIAVTYKEPFTHKLYFSFSNKKLALVKERNMLLILVIKTADAA